MRSEGTKRTYIALALEATGMQPERDEVIEIGAVKFSGHVGLDLAMLARGGVELKNVAWDTFELATLLVPEAAVYNLRAVAVKLGIDPEEDRAHRATADAELTMRVFLALRERIEDLPLEVLGEIGRATEHSDWPLRHLFQEVEHEKARDAFSSGLGSSIRSHLASKGMSDVELDLGLLRVPEEGYEGDFGYGSVPEGTGHDGPYPVDQAELESILKPGGAMSWALSQYEFRPQQIDMAKAVAAALNEGHHLIVEAGTGTGKSVGYLLPSILYATRTGERVIVSTNTINLQDQLFTKDLPLLHDVLDEPASNPKSKIQNLKLGTPAFRS